MKLCPVCKKSIIPDKWQYCYACEHKIDPKNSVWDGGFPCGIVGRIVGYNGVDLVVKNEIVECESQKGFAIYDENNQNIGVLYQKVDDGNYKMWYGDNYLDCQQSDEYGNPKEEFVKLFPGEYDVEAVFFDQYRNVYGDNRKIMISRYHIFSFDNFDKISKDVSKYGSSEFTFFNLQVSPSRERFIQARRDYKKRLW